MKVSGLLVRQCFCSLIIGPLGGGAVTTYLTIPELALILAEVMFAQVSRGVRDP